MNILIAVVIVEPIIIAATIIYIYEIRLSKYHDILPFYDNAIYCIKCGRCYPQERRVIKDLRFQYGYSGEVIEKTCYNCSYIWWEHTKDFK